MAKVVARSPSVDMIKVESVEARLGETVTVPIVVENPQGLDAFALQLTYPAELIEFQSLSATAITED